MRNSDSLNNGQKKYFAHFNIVVDGNLVCALDISRRCLIHLIQKPILRFVTLELVIGFGEQNNNLYLNKGQKITLHISTLLLMAAMCSGHFPSLFATLTIF